MFGLGMGAPMVKSMVKIGKKSFAVEELEPFLNDLYANARLELPDKFNPVDEVIRVVETLRKQGAQNG